MTVLGEAMDRFIRDLDVSGIPDEPPPEVPPTPAERLLREVLAGPHLAHYPHAVVILIGSDATERFLVRESGLSPLSVVGLLEWVKAVLLRARG